MRLTSKQKIIQGALEDIAEADRETALVLCRGLDGYLMGDEDEEDDLETKRMRRKAREAYATLRSLLSKDQS